MATISKAQEKRNAQNRATLSSKVSKQLTSFKNQYIGDYVNYELAQIELLANAFKKSSIEAVKKDVIGKSFRDVKSTKSFSAVELNCFQMDYNHAMYGYNDTITGVSTYYVEQARKKLDLIEIEKVTFYAEALKSYEVKFNKVIDKMMQYDFNSYLVVDDVSSLGGDFEILIWNPKKENAWTSNRDKKLEGVEFFFHARLIYANGEIKRPHFRFITTTRKTYLSK